MTFAVDHVTQTRKGIADPDTLAPIREYRVHRSHRQPAAYASELAMIEPGSSPTTGYPDPTALIFEERHRVVRQSGCHDLGRSTGQFAMEMRPRLGRRVINGHLILIPSLQASVGTDPQATITGREYGCGFGLTILDRQIS